MTRNEYLADSDRRKRIGLDEAIFCETKSVDQIASILRDAESHNHELFLTRLLADQYHALPATLRSRLDYHSVSRTACFGVLNEADGNNETTGRGDQQVAIVTGGTSDAPAATEALRTLNWHGYDAAEICDVGVAGLWRLQQRIDDIARHPVVIAVAGMDAALPTVLGGLVGSVIIAVPTSTGYGVADGGRTAVKALLASCAPGITVVNIDNGYGAACAAIRVLRAIKP